MAMERLRSRKEINNSGVRIRQTSTISAPRWRDLRDRCELGFMLCPDGVWHSATCHLAVKTSTRQEFFTRASSFPESYLMAVPRLTKVGQYVLFNGQLYGSD